MKYNSLCCAGDITRLISERPIVIAKNPSGPNAYMHEALKKKENMYAKLGVSFMDFPGCRLLDQIINSNKDMML